MLLTVFSCYKSFDFQPENIQPNNHNCLLSLILSVDCYVRTWAFIIKIIGKTAKYLEFLSYHQFQHLEVKLTLDNTVFLLAVTSEFLGFSTTVPLSEFPNSSCKPPPTSRQTIRSINEYQKSSSQTTQVMIISQKGEPEWSVCETNTKVQKISSCFSLIEFNSYLPG